MLGRMNEMFDVKRVVEDELVEITVSTVPVHNTIPSYNSAAFWALANDAQTPLELLVKMLRLDAIDKRGRDDLFEIINRRIRSDNEHWAYWKLQAFHVSYEEIQLLKHDLCADLDFAIYRALIDKEKRHWEERFGVSLNFERRHVFSYFMQYERFWKSGCVEQSIRIPRARMISIDQVAQNLYGQDFSFDIEDDQAQKMMRSVELSYVRQCVLTIPYNLKVVICLIYWNGKSSKEIAQLLHVSDRTIRNRLHKAYKLLREALEEDFFYA